MKIGGNTLVSAVFPFYSYKKKAEKSGEQQRYFTPALYTVTRIKEISQHYSTKEHDTQHNNIQRNKILCNDIQYYDISQNVIEQIKLQLEQPRNKIKQETPAKLSY